MSWFPMKELNILLANSIHVTPHIPKLTRAMVFFCPSISVGMWLLWLPFLTALAVTKLQWVFPTLPAFTDDVG